MSMVIKDEPNSKLTPVAPVKVAGLNRTDPTADPPEDPEGIYWHTNLGAFKLKRVGNRLYSVATVLDSKWFQLFYYEMRWHRYEHERDLWKPIGTPDAELAVKWGLTRHPIAYLEFEVYQPVTLKTLGVSFCDTDHCWIPCPSFRWKGYTAVGLIFKNADRSEECALVCLDDEAKPLLTICELYDGEATPDCRPHCWRLQDPKWRTLDHGTGSNPPRVPIPPKTRVPQNQDLPWIVDGLPPPPPTAVVGDTTCTFKIQVGLTKPILISGRGRCEGFGTARSVRHVDIIVELTEPRLITASWGTIHSTSNTTTLPLPYSLPLRWLSILDALAACSPTLKISPTAWGCH